MGEAKRRKKLDPNYGKSPMLGWRTEWEWKKKLSLADIEWRRIRPHFRVVDTREDIDWDIDGVWVFHDQGEEIVSFSGKFALEFSNEDNVADSNFTDLDILDGVDDNIDGIWEYEDDKGNRRVSLTGRCAHEFVKSVFK